MFRRRNPATTSGPPQRRPIRSTIPFFTEWDAPFGTPPFDQIEIDHYEPAMMRGMAEHKAEIAAIARNPEFPNFANTIEAMDAAGALLTQVSNVFGAMNGTMTNDEMQAIAKRLAPAAVPAPRRDPAERRAVRPGRRGLSAARRAGPGRRTGPPADRNLEAFRARRGQPFRGRQGEAEGPERGAVGPVAAVRRERPEGDQQLRDGHRQTRPTWPACRPASIEAAAEAAAKRGHEGKWVFTLHKPSLIPFLQYSTRRDLREKMFKGYINVGNNGDELDNNAILARMAVAAGASGPTCWATPPTPPTSWTTTWPRTRRTSTNC